MTDERTCPFPDCEWTYEYDGDDYGSRLSADHRAQMHYEREHAGQVEIQVTLERTQLLGGRDPEAIRERYHDEDWSGWAVAHVRTEVLEEADDHGVLEGEDGP